MVEFQQLRCFLAVAHEGHFGRAAERLRLTSSPVSRAVKDLERDLGAELFVRGYHHVELTAAGRRLRAGLEPIFAKLDHLHEDMRNRVYADFRSLRIGATPTVPAALLDAVVHAAEEADPGCSLDVAVIRSADLLSAVERGNIQLGVVHLPIADPDLESLEIVAHAMVAVLRADDPLAHHDPLCIADLAGHTHVVMADSVPPATFEHMLAELPPDVAVHLEIVPAGDAVTLVAKVGRRGSVTFVPRGSTLGRMFVETRFVKVDVVDVPLLRMGVVWSAAAQDVDTRVELVLSRLAEGGAEPESTVDLVVAPD